MRLRLASALLVTSVTAYAQSITVAPYVQLATPESAWVLWETSANAESLVEFGLTPALGESSRGSSETSLLTARVHSVLLSGLQPETRYYYRVSVGGGSSGTIEHFTTPPRPESERGFRLVAMSDMQIDRRRSDQFREVVHEGIIDYVTAQFGPELDQELGFVLVPGDLVDNGAVHRQWVDEFFAPSAALISKVPVYPVPGNHERDSDHFFRFFHLPDNGTAGFEEHWWWLDYSNVRVLGLDSNSGYRNDAQLQWLDEALDAACLADHVDFVFAQLHHPHHSELWPAGNTSYTGEVIQRLEDFSTRCAKPSVHFFGHTHGYSRGQSRDHAHVMVNVASAGGNIDYWGEYTQTDYPEYTVSQDDYGFVLVEVEAGADPEFRLRRISRGNANQSRANEVRDAMRVRRFNTPPTTPQAIFPAATSVNPACVVLSTDPFEDPDGEPHGASHWQVSLDCTDFSAPVHETWRQHENWYDGVDREAGSSLIEETVTDLEPQTSYCWRVRHRDQGLAWSAWSAPTNFRTEASTLTPLPVVNPGAEDGVLGWTVLDGFFESVTDGQCNGISPHAGLRYFAVGGVCESAASAAASQWVDTSSHALMIDAGRAEVVFGAHLADFNGQDLVEMLAVFRDGSGDELGRSAPIARQAAGWTSTRGRAPVPVGTRTVEVVLMGTRNAGTDNDAYVDDVVLWLGQAAGPCDEAPPRPMDAGVPIDTGVPVDAGVLPDAANPDAAELDLGFARDAAPAPTDAGQVAAPDAGRGSELDSSGCTCQRPARSVGTTWLIAGLLFVLRRRRSRRQR